MSIQLSPLTADAQRRVDLLEQVYLHIQHTRMRDLPLLNPDLQVCCLDFQIAQDQGLAESCFGILLTPWCMNMLLLPVEKTHHPALDGSTHSYAIGKRQFEFIHASEASLGSYAMCSLFSPMFEFKSQHDACATAQVILQTLHTEIQENHAQHLAAPAQTGRRAFLRGWVGAAK